MTLHDAPFDMLQWLPAEAADAVVKAARRRRLSARETIYPQSAEGDEMFRVVAGSVRLSVLAADGRELLYQLFGPGDCFGTSSLVDGEPRPQTAEAFDAVELQVWDRATISRLRKDFPELVDALLRLLSRHMRLLSDYFAGATLDEISLRLAQRLVATANVFGVSGADGIALSIKVSQSELALMVGTTRQTINRILQQFQDNGWVSMRGGVVTITNIGILGEAARSGSLLRNFV